MSKKRYTTKYDPKIVEAIKKLPSPIYDKRHDIYVYFNDVKVRCNETRFEHIAKQYHELKVRDINLIKNGINILPIVSNSSTIPKVCYNELVRGGESVRDHDALEIVGTVNRPS